jgi:hypothetical protein
MVGNTAQIMPATRAEKEIRERSADTSNIVWTTHAKDQMEHRDITTQDAVRVLRDGFIKGSPRKGRNDGECNRSESPQRMLTSLLKSEEVVRRPLGDVLQ